MTQTFSQSPDPNLVTSNTMEPQPTPANTTLEDHNLERTLALKDSLGAALTKQGRYSEAATLLQEVLTIRESLNQSPTSRGMLCTMNNLAAALRHQGHLASAEALHRRVLETDTQTLGISHPSTLTAMSNLAALLAQQGPDNDKDNAKLSEAADMLQRALPLSRDVNGPKSLSTLHMMGFQVSILIRQEKYEQAEGTARELLALQREVLRAQHPDIAPTMRDLGWVLRRLGKLEEAEVLGREERAIMEFKEEETVDLRGGDGLLAMHEGRYKEAERIFRERLVTGVA